MATAGRLTPAGIERAKADETDIWLSDNDGTRGGGRLVVRVSPTGTKLFYFRYQVNGARKQIPMRPFAAQQVAGRYTLKQARDAAREYSELHRMSESRDVAAYLASIEAATKASAKQEQERAQEQAAAAAAASKYTLKALCEAYVAHLKALKKASAEDVHSVFSLHVYATESASLPAKDITPKQIVALLRSLVEAGKGRTAAKLRSNLRAAYQIALVAETDASHARHLVNFEIQNNPAASTAALSKFNKVRTRNLSDVELGIVWHRLTTGEPNPSLAVRGIRLLILLGGQRSAQMLRCQVADIDLEGQTIRLLDPKGRRETPRVHSVPYGTLGAEEITALIERAAALEASSLFASMASTMASTTMSSLIAELSAALLASKAIRQPFQLRDLRRTVETMLAAMNVPDEVRAQLQSHGLGGIQNRHYNMYGYLKEKREAIQIWEAHLQVLAMKAERLERAEAEASSQRTS